jgi:simple sugar transport system ATP-binding protein
VSDAAPLLALDHISKRFGATAALRDASFHLQPRTLHALLGENGAGKTTLMRIAFGMVPADSGQITLEGRRRSFTSPADAIAAGIGMVHQHFSLVPAMTIAENVSLGGRGRFDHRSAARSVERIARETGLSLDPSALVRTLSVAQQQRVEIVKALAHGARLLILDEPTAVLAPAEASELLAWLSRFVGEGGAAVLITHKLRDALTCADAVTVLRRGQTTLAGRTTGLDERALLDAMLGGSGAEEPASPVAPSESASEPRITLRDAAFVDERRFTRLQPTTLEVRAGEILGVAAVEGAGQRELLRLLAGRLEPTSGTVVRPPLVGFVPEDRHRDGLILDMSLVENVALRGAGAKHGTVDWDEQETQTAELLRRFRVLAAGPLAKARDLSGGNQQRLVLARELGSLPDALVAENPTRGLDVRATAAVHEHLRAARAARVAIVLFSSDLDEVLALADRMVVVHDGRVRETASDREIVGRTMVGAIDAESTVDGQRGVRPAGS